MQTGEDPAEALLAQTRAFAEHCVAPRAARWHRQGQFCRNTLREAAALGLSGLQVPQAQGGLGLAFPVKVQMAECLAAADFGFALSIINTGNVAWKLSRDAAPEVAARHLPALLSGEKLGATALTEPRAGTDLAAIETTATKERNGWRLSGEKAWIVNAAAADLIVTFAQTEPGSGASGIAAFLVDATRPGFTRLPPPKITGPASIGTGSFRLDGYHVKGDEVMLPPGLAFRTILNDINGARTYVAAMCCGMVAAALRIVSDYGTRRKTFGQTLSQHQGWRWTLAETEVDLAAARALVSEAAKRVEAGADCRHQAAQAKIFATRMALRHLPALGQLMGAEGLRDHYPFGRHVEGARIAGLVDGTTEILLETLARRHIPKEGETR
ncbi:acyl-CoA dehydrogenase family protein [Marinovum sp.]|uniref:acyl-CoA dehydrogenase family protein n=1 Tax=Marinovum sp. TaxID=2024839 RepID=UPI002B27BB4F|nr:acyl-CoA dehydrogenase family protein [Marinovum sp.]